MTYDRMWHLIIFQHPPLSLVPLFRILCVHPPLLNFPLFLNTSVIFVITSTICTATLVEKSSLYFCFFFGMGWISAFRLFCRYLARYPACSVYLTGYLVVVRQDFWLVEICQVGYLTDYRFFSLHFPNIGPNIFQISGLSLNLPCAICV